MKISIRIKDKGAEDFRLQEIKRIENISNQDIERIAKRCESVIRYMIENKANGGTGDLANSDGWTAEAINNGWGVGDIVYLNENNKYWRHCLDEEIEVYIYINKKLIPISLKDLFVLWNNNKDIKILTPNGLKNIINLREIFEFEYYEAYFSHFYNIKMSKDHKLIYKLNNSYIEKSANSFNKRFNCYSGLCSPLNVFNDDIIQDYIELNNIKIKLDYLYGWIIGFTLADGYVQPNTHTICWGQKTINNIEDKIYRFCSQFFYKPYVDIDKNLQFRVCSHNKIIYDFISYFCSGTKENKNITNFYLNTPKEFRQGILSGYNFGDGRKNDQNKYHIRTISKKMYNQLILIGSSLGYDISILQNQKPSKTGFKGTLELYNAYIYEYCRRWQVKRNICSEIRKDKKNRKRSDEGKFQKNNYKSVYFTYFPKTLLNIKKINKNIRLIDIAVEDELFLINGGLISHNCNYGSVAIGANWDHYLPKGYWENGRWIESEHGYSGIKPKNPLPPLNYIEDTIAQMELEIPKILKEK